MASCLGLDKENYVAYYLENKAGVNILLTLTNMISDGKTRKDTTIRLGNNEVWYYGGENLSAEYAISFHTDSALLVFNGIDEVLYVLNDPSPRNILDINNYTGGKQRSKSPNDLFVFTYTITEEDYLDAKN